MDAEPTEQWLLTLPSSVPVPHSPAPAGQPIVPQRPPGPVARPGPPELRQRSSPSGEERSSALRRKVSLVESEKDDLRIQLQQVWSTFQSREAWWTENVIAARDNVRGAVLANHAQQEAVKAQYELNLKVVESAIQAAENHVAVQDQKLRERADLILSLEQALSQQGIMAQSEVARLQRQLSSQSVEAHAYVDVVNSET